MLWAFLICICIFSVFATLPIKFVKNFEDFLNILSKFAAEITFNLSFILFFLKRQWRIDKKLEI